MKKQKRGDDELNFAAEFLGAIERMEKTLNTRILDPEQPGSESHLRDFAERWDDGETIQAPASYFLQQCVELTVTVGKLTDEHARAEPFADRTSFISKLSEFHPNLKEIDEVFIFAFMASEEQAWDWRQSSKRSCWLIASCPPPFSTVLWFLVAQRSSQ
jgi:hypothetical protein